MFELQREQHVLLLGEQNSGKTYQADRLFNLCLRYKGANCYPFRRALYLAIGSDRSSAAYTSMAEHADCDFVQVAKVDDLKAKLASLTPADGRPHNYGLVVIDSWSGVRVEAIAEVHEQAIHQTQGASRSFAGQAKKNISNNARDMGALAQPEICAAISLAQRITRAPINGRQVGALTLSLCHTGWNEPGEGRAPYYHLALSRTARDLLTRAANQCWLMRKRVPSSFGMATPQQINEAYRSGAVRDTFEAITRDLEDKDLGRLAFLKRQAGKDGAFADFEQLDAYWQEPDLAHAFAVVIARQWKKSLGEQVDAATYEIHDGE